MENNSENKYICQKCGKLVTKKFGSGKFCSRKCANSHIQTDEQNKRRSETLRNTIQYLKDKNIWDTEKRILNNKRQGIIGKIHYNNNPKYCKVCGNKLPYELRYRKCCSDICRAKSRGGYRRSKIFLYKGIKLQSSFELQVAKELDFYNIKWIRPKAFIYNYIKIRKYTPDFYLPDYDVYLDPKNDFLATNINPLTGINDLQKLKLVEEQNNIIIIPLLKNQLNWTIIKGLIAQKKSARLTSERL